MTTSNHEWNHDEDRPLIVIGAGGHAKVVIGALRAAGRRVTAAFDDDRSRHGQRLLEVPVAGLVRDAPVMYPDAWAVLGIGAPEVRAHLAERLPLSWTTVVHPHAFVDPTAVLGAGVVVMAGAVVQPDTILGRHSVINTCASVDHDSRIGEFANIGPGAHLSGNVTVGEGAMIGVGAVILPGIAIGAGTIVGGGAVVIRDLPARVTAVGCPARVIRQGEARAA